MGAASLLQRPRTPNSWKTSLFAMAAGALVLAATADAVTLNPRGMGQVLIYPYYTANAGFGTLLSIVNTTADGKALKLRFHEGRNGRVVLALNLYLSPFDAWVGEVFDSNGRGTGDAALATNDRSCAVPAFAVDAAAALPVAKFSTASYTGVHADGGPSDGARAHEGYVEVLEMGVVTNAAQNTLAAITHDSNGVPANCAQVDAAWSAGGYWTGDPGIDLGPPTGGLYGAASLIDVADGLMYTINAAAIDGFSNAIQHSDPSAAAPDLNTASPNAQGSFSAFIVANGRMIEADYPRSEDAISALFMADNLYNEYVADANVGATSDWMITFPTKRFYTDPALLAAGASQARPPFDLLFGSANGGTSCIRIDTQFWDREEETVTSGFIFPPPPPPVEACFATSPLTIGSSTSALGSHLLASTPFTTQIDIAPVGFKSGWMREDFTVDAVGTAQTNHVISSINGPKLLGLPALGFFAVNYVNANVSAGVLANYSGAYPHRAHVTCLTAAGAGCP